MWLLDSFKPSYNFAKNIKLILNKIGVDTTYNNIISWYNLLIIHDSIADILRGYTRISPDLNINILTDIKVFLSVGFYTEYYNNKTTKSHEEIEYFIHIFDDRKLIFSEFLKFDQNRSLSNEEQIRIFDNLKLNILEFTYEVMNYSTFLKWLPDYFNEKDKQIVKDFYWF